MTSISLKLSVALEQKVIAAAHVVGVTPHAFMVDTIRQAATAAEKRAQFVAEAKAARKDMLKTGLGYDADDVYTHLRKRVAGSKVVSPKAKSWRS